MAGRDSLGEWCEFCAVGFAGIGMPNESIPATGMCVRKFT